MINRQLIFAGFFMIGGFVLLFPKTIKNDDINTRGFVRALRLWGLLWIVKATFNIVFFYNQDAVERGLHSMVILKRYDTLFAGLLLGIPIALVVSGQAALRYKHEKSSRQNKLNK